MDFSTLLLIAVLVFLGLSVLGFFLRLARGLIGLFITVAVIGGAIYLFTSVF